MCHLQILHRLQQAICQRLCRQMHKLHMACLAFNNYSQHVPAARALHVRWHWTCCTTLT